MSKITITCSKCQATATVASVKAMKDWNDLHEYEHNGTIFGRIVSPDCRDKNHQKCPGDAWDEAHDHLTECQCSCHPPLSNTSGFKGIDTTGLLPAHTCHRPGPGYPLGVIWQCLECKETYRMESVRDRGVSQNEWARFEMTP